jgi:hypothetical protein
MRMTSRAASALMLAVATLVLCASPARAQLVGGRVVRMGAHDTIAVPGVRVVLHALTASHQGPVDSAMTDATGGFRFKAPKDTSALLLASSDHDGIGYFSRPSRAGPTRSDTTLVVVIADTSSTAPVTVAERYIMIGRPESGGRRGALDLLVLQNGGELTRVARDGTSPAWTTPLPVGIADFAPGESEFSSAAVGRKGDSLTVSAPISPGSRQLMVTYTLPLGAKGLTIPLVSPVDSMVVLLEERDAKVITPGFTAADTQVVESRTYRRWVGSLNAPGTVEVQFARVGETGTVPIRVLAALLGLGLLIGGFILVRRRSRAVPVAATGRSDVGDDPAALIEWLARLDAQYAGREQEVDAVEWAQYQQKRARLRAALDLALAARGQGPQS